MTGSNNGNNARQQRLQNIQTYEVLTDLFTKHLERIDRILDEQNKINQQLSTDQATTKTRLDILLKTVLVVTTAVVALATTVAGGIIVYWLTHPH